MKHLILLIALSSYSYFSHAQERNYFKQPTVKSGIGVGPNYGMIGSKTVVGKNNSGLLLGLGTVSGKLGYQIGGQIGWKSIYLSGGYGAYGSGKEINGPTHVLEGINFTSGVIRSLSDRYPIFIDLGVGYSFGGPHPVFERDWDGVNVAFGLVYAFNSNKSEKPRNYLALNK